MANTDHYRFSDTHEWFNQQGNVITVGLSKFAVDELTDITYVEMKPVGTAIKPGSSVGEVESVKTTSEIYSAISGTVCEINQDVVKDPSLLNSDPYDKGWLIRIKTDDTAPLQNLMDNATYQRKHPVG
ncbi:MAG TPA: glycine cleavage system protein GcvH [Phycisphaerales bacterium]|nr:glycine cleavage system protein GcvH [Phycisphaerales bacterium]